jgi:hypothetical protein
MTRNGKEMPRVTAGSMGSNICPGSGEAALMRVINAVTIVVVWLTHHAGRKENEE